jgi:hypothetical protein
MTTRTPPNPPPHSLHPNAVQPAISTVRCAYKSFKLNVLILGHGDDTFVGLIQRTGE